MLKHVVFFVCASLIKLAPLVLASNQDPSCSNRASFGNRLRLIHYLAC
jgi:hypothetical protein